MFSFFVLKDYKIIGVIENWISFNCKTADECKKVNQSYKTIFRCKTENLTSSYKNKPFSKSSQKKETNFSNTCLIEKISHNQMGVKNYKKTTSQVFIFWQFKKKEILKVYTSFTIILVYGFIKYWIWSF